MTQSPKNLVLPLLLCLLACAAFQAPQPVVVWLVIAAVAGALVAGLAITSLFLISLLAQTLRAGGGAPALGLGRELSGGRAGH